MSQTPKWLESLILIFILLAGAILGFTFLVEQPPHTPLYPDVPSAESGWLTGFLYRKSGWFKDTTGALSFFPVTFVVHYGDGTDGTDVVYLDSKCQSDFDDIRFTDSTGSAEFDYWLDPDFTYDGDNVTVWVESVNSMAGTDIAFYIYYGNDTTSTTSSASDVFTIYDDFNRANNATVGNGWTEDEGPTGGALAISSNTLKITQYQNYFCHVQKSSVQFYNHEVIVKYKQLDNGASWTSAVVSWWEDGDWYRLGQYGTGKISAEERIDSALTSTQTGILTEDIWYYLKVNTNSSHVRYYYATVLGSWTLLRTATKGGDWTGPFYFLLGKGNDSPAYGTGSEFNNNYTAAGLLKYSYFDWVRLRKITTTGEKVVVYNWGGQEPIPDTVSPYLPVASGDKTEWNASGVNDNWEYVDEGYPSDGDSGYIRTNYDGESFVIDLYNIEPVSVRAGMDVEKIILTAYSRYTIRTGPQLYLMVSVEGNEYLSSAIAMTTAWGYDSYTWTVNPDDTDFRWNQTSFNSLQVGVKGRTDYFISYSVIRVSAIWMFVYYKPDPTLTLNASVANEICNFTADWLERDGEMDAYIFGHNKTGTFVNSSETAFSAGSSTSTEHLNLTDPTTPLGGWLLEYQFWAKNNGSVWNTTGLGKLWVWLISQDASERIFGISQGSSRWGGAFYYNGSATGGADAIYVAYCNSTLTTWRLNARAFSVSTEVWTDYHDLGIAMGNDAHWNPSITRLPNGSLCMVYGYFGSPYSIKYRVGKQNISTVSNLNTIISDWNSEYAVESNHFDYPQPLAWDDWVVVFGRSGAGSDEGNWSRRQWNGTHFDNETTLIYMDAGYYDDETLYANVNQDGNNIYLGFSRYNITKGADENLYMIYSTDRGMNWRHWNGTTLTLPIWGENALVAEMPTRIRAGAPFLDENGTFCFPYFYRYLDRGYGWPGLAQYSTTPGSVGTWTTGNLTDSDGNQIMGWCTVLYNDNFYGRPSGWGGISTVNDHLGKMVREWNETRVFRVVLEDTDYGKVHVIEYGGIGVVRNTPGLFEALLQERAEDALSYYPQGANKQVLNSTTLYAVKIVANRTIDLTTVQICMDVNDPSDKVFFALYNSTGHWLAESQGKDVDSTIVDPVWALPVTWNLQTGSANIVAGETYYIALKVDGDGIGAWYYDDTGGTENFSMWADNGWLVSYPDVLSDIEETWNNYTRIASTRSWSSQLVMRGTGVRPPTNLAVGWNQVAAWGRDLTHTLAEVNASLNSESISWTVIVLEYANGSEYGFIYGYHIDDTSHVVNAMNDYVWLFINVVDTWNHEY